MFIVCPYLLKSCVKLVKMNTVLAKDEFFKHEHMENLVKFRWDAIGSPIDIQKCRFIKFFVNSGHR